MHEIRYDLDFEVAATVCEHLARRSIIIGQLFLSSVNSLDADRLLQDWRAIERAYISIMIPLRAHCNSALGETLSIRGTGVTADTFDMHQRTNAAIAARLSSESPTLPNSGSAPGGCGSASNTDKIKKSVSKERRWANGQRDQDRGRADRT